MKRVQGNWWKYFRWRSSHFHNLCESWSKFLRFNIKFWIQINFVIHTQQLLSNQQRFIVHFWTVKNDRTDKFNHKKRYWWSRCIKSVLLVHPTKCMQCYTIVRRTQLSDCRDWSKSSKSFRSTNHWWAPPLHPVSVPFYGNFCYKQYKE